VSLVSFGIRKPVAANLVMFAIIGAGLVFGVNLRREFFPETRPNEVIVAAPYPGAAPDEIEESLAIKIEDRIADLRDVKEINTTATEGAATIRIEFEEGIGIETAVARVKREVDALQDLPDRAERITVTEFEPNIPVVNLSLHGDAGERTLKNAIQQIRNDLRALPGMGDVLLAGVRRDEVTVEARQEALLQYGLSLPDIAARVRQSMQETPGGTIRSATANVPVRTLGAEERVEEVRRIVVRSDPQGRPIRLGEIATVTEGFEDADIRTRFDGEPALSLVVYGVGSQDVLDIANMVKAYVQGRNREALDLTFTERLAMRFGGDGGVRTQAYELGLSRPPPPVSLTPHNDIARFVDQRLQLLARNALWGGALVFLTLLLLLAPRVALWVTAGLTISVLGTLVSMYLLDISLNFLTMFGLIVVLGLLVDDAIVVAENISAHHEEGEPALQAAESGAREVEWPVVTTVLTTICAFLPLLLIAGRIGDLFGALPIVVTVALLVSLVESLFILPSHMGHSLLKADRAEGRSLAARFFDAVGRVRTRTLQGRIIPAYSVGLRACLRARYLTLTLAVAVLIGALGLVAGGRVPFVFIESADSETVLVELRMPIGTPLEVTDDVMRKIERAAGAAPEVKHLQTVVGARQDLEGGGGIAQSHLGQIFIELVPVEERDRISREVIDSIRASLGPLPGVKSLRFSEVQGGPGGQDISLAVVGENPAQVDRVARALEARLGEFEGVYEVSNDADRGQRELRFRLRDGAKELGFTTAGVAEQVRAAVFGLEPYTFPGDREDVDVRVMLEEPARRSLTTIESMQVFTPDGRPVPLSEAVEIEEAEAFATVRRLNRQRAVTVSADVDRSLANPEEVTAALTPDLRRLVAENPGLRIVPRGRQEDIADSFRTLPLGALAAAGMIYILLAWLFSSYAQPIFVLMVTPFAVIGAVLGHYLLGFDLTILSLIGLVALIGIVVNDSLILTQFFNKKRHEGLGILDALVAAGEARFRAILLTTLTTVLGLSPLMLEQSFQARFLIPMAITISFGLLAATMITLVVLPCVLLISDDVRRILAFLWTGRMTHLQDRMLPETAPEEESAQPG